MQANSLEMAACREPPQLSCCRCVSRIATSATPKRNRMARLITPITAKGMFSRYRTSPPKIERATGTMVHPVLIRQPRKIILQGIHSRRASIVAAQTDTTACV